MSLLLYGHTSVFTVDRTYTFTSASIKTVIVYWLVRIVLVMVNQHHTTEQHYEVHTRKTWTTWQVPLFRMLGKQGTLDTRRCLLEEVDKGASRVAEIAKPWYPYKYIEGLKDGDPTNVDNSYKAEPHRDHMRNARTTSFMRQQALYDNGDHLSGNRE